MQERKIVKQELRQDIGPYHVMTGTFEADQYPHEPILDTNVDLTIPTFAIIWDNRFDLLAELASVIEKYQI